MIAAIYARKSTEQNGVNEEDKSVTRQIDHAKAYAEKKGWTVSPESIYADDGISGAEFVKRLGFLRLMNSLRPKQFDVLIMSEESRLGREQIKTAYALQQITDAGVQVWFYLTDQERKLDSAMDKVMQSLAGFAAEMEREKTGQRTHDALLKKARALHVVGCKVYGYNNVDVCGPDGMRLHVVRQINAEQRAVILRIFESYANGIGLELIAKTLNRDGVPPPRGDRKGWAGSCIRAILHRPLYRGTIIWNQTKAIVRHGTKTSIRRPKSEWEIIDAPELRIVSPDLWRLVEQRMAVVRTQYVRTAAGTLLSRPSGADLRSQYLLSGIAQCAICGGSLVCQLRRKTEGKNVYTSAYYHNRGRAICTNDLRINQGILDSALLHALTHVLDEQIIADAVKRALAELRAEQMTFPEERLKRERHLALVVARIKHLVNAVATGKATDGVWTELHQVEDEKKSVLRQLAELNLVANVTSLDAKRLERTLLDKVSDVTRLLGKHVPQARQMLRKLLDGRLICTPFQDARGRGYELTATGTYAGLLGEKLLVKHGGGEGGI